MTEPDRPDGFTWAACLHRPGPAAPESGSIFDAPLFAEHVAWLQRRLAAGELVAAGPLGDEEGAGMTILRLTGAGRHADAEALATIDDRSVAEGLFVVAVRPWHVLMAG